jgi:hypothetical protein
MSRSSAWSTGNGRPKPAPLAEDASAALRDRLIHELERTEPASLTAWAHRSLPLKNQLSIADAQAVEKAFDAALARPDPAIAAPEMPRSTAPNDDATAAANEIALMIDKPVRERDRHHLRFVASKPCLVCGRTPSDAHHVKFAQGPALGRKVSDRYTVPLCRLHHRDLHKRGNERPWWQNQGIDPLAVASMLWRESHALDPTIDDPGQATRAQKMNGEAINRATGKMSNGQD